MLGNLKYDIGMRNQNFITMINTFAFLHLEIKQQFKYSSMNLYCQINPQEQVLEQYLHHTTPSYVLDYMTYSAIIKKELECEGRKR